MTDERLKKSAGDNRQSRAVEDRTKTENRALSDDERVEMFRQQFFQSSLPDLPKIPGWHMCWPPSLSTQPTGWTNCCRGTTARIRRRSAWLPEHRRGAHRMDTI